MPQLIPQAEFDQKFRSDARNVSDLMHFVEKGVTDYSVEGVELPDGYRFVESNHERVYQGEPIRSFRLIHSSGDTLRTVYAVNIQVSGHVVNGKHFSQIMVWRSGSDQHDEVLFRFAKRVFNHFLNEYIVVVSDTQQTSEGRGFWVRRIENAHDAGQFVYFTDLNNLDGDMIPILNRIDTHQDFIDTWFDHGWGQDEEYKDRLFVISKDELS